METDAVENDSASFFLVQRLIDGSAAESDSHTESWWWEFYPPEPDSTGALAAWRSQSSLEGALRHLIDTVLQPNLVTVPISTSDVELPNRTGLAKPDGTVMAVVNEGSQPKGEADVYEVFRAESMGAEIVVDYGGDAEYSMNLSGIAAARWWIANRKPDMGDERGIAQLRHVERPQIYIDHGAATPEDVGEVMAMLSETFRAFGGSGINFTRSEIRELKPA